MKYTIVCLWHDEGNKLILCINQNINETSTEPQDLSLLKKHLNDFEQPDATYYVDTLPLNNHGKVDRKKLLENFLRDQEEPNQIPLQIFNNFLKGVLGFREKTLRSEEFKQIKRPKSDLFISFTEAGGTSFQALSLATEIGNQLLRPEDRRKLLEMLLSSNISTANIIEFLSKVPYSLVTKEQIFQNKDIVTNYITANKKFIGVLWRSNLKKCVDASPTLLQKKYVSVGSHSKLLLTLDVITGTEISRIELSDRIECPVVCVSSDLALVGCYDGIVYGFNYNIGEVLWKLNVQGMIKAKPLYINNLIIVASYADDFNIRAYELKVR